MDTSGTIDSGAHIFRSRRLAKDLGEVWRGMEPRASIGFVCVSFGMGPRMAMAHDAASLHHLRNLRISVAIPSMAMGRRGVCFRISAKLREKVPPPATC